MSRRIAGRVAAQAPELGSVDVAWRLEVKRRARRIAKDAATIPADDQSREVRRAVAESLDQVTSAVDRLPNDRWPDAFRQMIDEQLAATAELVARRLPTDSEDDEPAPPRPRKPAAKSGQDVPLATFGAALFAAFVVVGGLILWYFVARSPVPAPAGSVPSPSVSAVSVQVSVPGDDWGTP